MNSTVHQHSQGVAFEWFRKLLKGSITCWDDLEALFLSRFFEEEADINMHTLLLTKQKEGELVKDFIEDSANSP